MSLFPFASFIVLSGDFGILVYDPALCRFHLLILSIYSFAPFVQFQQHEQQLTRQCDSVIENYTQSYTYTVNLTGGATLGQVDAEWIVEDPYGSGGQVPFPKFGTVWFEDVYATTTNGTILDVDSSTMIYLDNPPLCEAAEYDSYDFYAWST